ncbi:MAG: amidohydrolase [Butyrivibrio sp.]|nr:amidohydrolase [Butyrivibrio sp.]
MGNIYGEAEKIKKEIIELRRWFHAHPEASFEEVKTAGKIREELDKLYIPWKKVGNATVATIKGINGGPVIGLRADMDALEITEKNEVPYRSLTPGLMHACGHDAHMAALLGAAKILINHTGKIGGTIKLIFQPAEEIGRGAQTIVDSGLIDDVDYFFGIHVRAMQKVGVIEVSDGAIMGGANSLDITLKGKSGHGGRPHETIDTITCGAQIVQGLQYILSREIPADQSAVITIGQFHAGTRDNIVAGEAHLSGTVRVLDDDVRSRIAEAIKRTVDGIALANRVEATVKCDFATPVLKNSSNLYQTVLASALHVTDEDKIIPATSSLGTEDFSAYSQIAPSFFAFVGSEGEYPHHHERFDINEDALPIAAALHVAFALETVGNANVLAS